MKVLWEKRNQSASEIYKALAPKHWKPNTVRTFLNRLVQKKAAHVKRQNKVGCYSALWKEKDCIFQESEGFLQKVFQGKPSLLFLHFAEKSTLSQEDVAELKKILDTKNPTQKK